MNSANKTVLIADEDDIVRAGLRALLEGSGRVNVVAEVESASSLMEKVNQHRPDVVIIDTSAQGANGTDLVARLTEQNPDAKVVILSTQTESHFVRQLLESGVAGYLPKSSAIDELDFALRTIESGRVYLSPVVASAVLEDYKTGDRGRSGGVLSNREKEVLQSIADGRTAAQIAEMLSLSVKTVESHRRNIMNKLELHSVSELTKYAIREGLTGLD